ncbi:MAG: NAD(P)-binding protein [Cyanobacteria bacterium REEB67]|nr:NAD(P)-binding protein [Cyanobacteria bacterium REEB67]
MSTSISRATFLKGLAGLAVAGLGGGSLAALLQKSRHIFPCRMLGPTRSLGHLLRDPAALAKAKAGTNTEQTIRQKKVVIVGGGMAGLSAAWWLKKNHFDNFVLLELEKEVGGNAACGKNDWGSYPWGAHYVPIPNPESAYVRELFEELKIIQAYSKAGEPIYDDLMLCHEPQERLYKDGSFHEGLVPKRGLQPAEAADISRFFGSMVGFRQAKGKDGKAAFAIPLDLSTSDARFRDLDKITMSRWLDDNNFKTKPLLWYVTYCCRDDYGATPDNVSAWAGIHYFAGRRGTAANAEQNAVLTWPQGNGYLAGKLRELCSEFIEVNALVTGVEAKINAAGEGNDSKTKVSYLSSNGTAKGESKSIDCDYVIFAAPRFVAAKIIDAKTFSGETYDKLNYAPWMVANISLKRLPDTRGTALAWDNVSYYSDSLGYVVANHQEISTREKPLVITYYYPLSKETPKVARQNLYSADIEKWRRVIIEDLSKIHPDIERQILAIDLWPWGHGMIRPDTGFIWGDLREEMKKSVGSIVFAHSDMSGMSNFEEAQYHGVEAAKTILAKIGRAGA